MKEINEVNFQVGQDFNIILMVQKFIALIIL